MSQRLTPCKRDDFIHRLRVLGFEGPFRGTRHEFMVYQEYRLPIPSYDEYAVPMLKDMISEIEGIIGRKIPRQEWARLQRARVKR